MLSSLVAIPETGFAGHYGIAQHILTVTSSKTEHKALDTTAGPSMTAPIEDDLYQPSHLSDGANAVTGLNGHEHANAQKPAFSLPGQQDFDRRNDMIEGPRLTAPTAQDRVRVATLKGNAYEPYVPFRKAERRSSAGFATLISETTRVGG